MVLVELLIILVSVTFTLILYFKTAFTYWEKKKVPFIKPHFPAGNVDDVIFKPVTTGKRYKKLYDDFKERGYKYAGFYYFCVPLYMPVDPEYVKAVFVNDFEHFTSRGLYFNEEVDKISANLFLVGNEEGRWRSIRSRTTPFLTVAKLKMMFPIVIECAKQMTEIVDNYCQNKQPIEMKELLACFTTDVISSYAFGIERNTCKDPNDQLRKVGRGFFTVSKFDRLKNGLSALFPNVCRALGLRVIRADIAGFFYDIMHKTVSYRETNNYRRKDYMQSMIDAKNNSRGSSNAFTFDELVASAFAFFIGGFETSSTTSSFALYELALNSEIQEKARREVKEVLSKYDGELTYEALYEMKYLGQIVDESLRKYPVLPFLSRKCTKDCYIPGTDSILDKGTLVFISILGLHHDPEYFPEPKKFDPERFSEENKTRIPQFAYLPFGGGPRICIGLRFGEMQVRLVLAILLNRYKFTLNEKTEVPLKFGLYNFSTSIESDILVNMERI